MKNIRLLFLYITFSFAFQNVNAQSLARDVIGSAGTFTTFSSGSMAWTIGEVMIETYNPSANYFTQGFHQPDEYKIIPITDFFIPEGFSPNGDGINDVFFIRGLNNYPLNSIIIFNRWGNKVYEANPYTNIWDGKSIMGVTLGGDDLPVGTYFYVFNKGDGSSVFKGTIYLNK